METRLLTLNDMEHVRTMFRLNPTIEKKVLTPEEIEIYIEHLAKGIREDRTYVVMSFESNEPKTMYVTYLYEKIGACYIGLTKIAKPSVNFMTSAKLMAPAFDFHTNLMEEKGYFKIWMTASERNHNIRNAIMRKYSSKISHYDWYDEIVVPPGEMSGVPYFDFNRLSVTTDSSMLVRLFILKEEHRLKLFENNGPA